MTALKFGDSELGIIKDEITLSPARTTFSLRAVTTSTMFEIDLKSPLIFTSGNIALPGFNTFRFAMASAAAAEPPGINAVAGFRVNAEGRLRFRFDSSNTTSPLPGSAGFVTRTEFEVMIKLECVELSASVISKEELGANSAVANDAFGTEWLTVIVQLVELPAGETAKDAEVRFWNRKSLAVIEEQFIFTAAAMRNCSAACELAVASVLKRIRSWVPSKTTSD